MNKKMILFALIFSLILIGGTAFGADKPGVPGGGAAQTGQPVVVGTPTGAPPGAPAGVPGGGAAQTAQPVVVGTPMGTPPGAPAGVPGGGAAQTGQPVIVGSPVVPPAEK